MRHHVASRSARVWHRFENGFFGSCGWSGKTFHRIAGSPIRARTRQMIAAVRYHFRRDRHMLEELHEKAPDGFEGLVIDVRDNPAAARAFEREFGITYPSFDDQDGQVLASFAGVVPVSAVPSTIVVDQSGVIRASIVGKTDTRTLRGLIDDLLRAA